MLNKGEEGHSIHFDVNTIVKSLMAKSRQYLAKVKYQLSQQFASAGLKIKTETVEVAAQTIADYARNQGVELIVMATHGYTGVKRMMLGSAAQKTLHEANAPLLLLVGPDGCAL